MTLPKTGNNLFEVPEKFGWTEFDEQSNAYCHYLVSNPEQWVKGCCGETTVGYRSKVTNRTDMQNPIHLMVHVEIQP